MMIQEKNDEITLVGAGQSGAAHWAARLGANR